MHNKAASSTRHVVYDPNMWPHIAVSGQREELCQWLHANGIDPDDVPISAEIAIEPASRKGARLIRHTVFLRDETGHGYLDPSTGDTAQEERTVPLVVAPPALESREQL